MQLDRMIWNEAGKRLVGLLLGLAIAWPGSAEVQTFEEVTEVVEVRVPVNVFSRDGESVRGLTADAFEIYDNGEPQEIVDFQVVDLSLIEPGVTRVEMERSIPPAARRHFLLLFDLSFSSPTSLVRAREAAREFVLNEVHPTDLVGVGMHTVESGGQILVTFTPDRAQVARAIDTLGAPRLLQLARRDPLRFLIDDPMRSGFDASSDIADRGSTRVDLGDDVLGHLRVVAKGAERMEKSFQRGRIFSWSHSMGDFARLLDSVQGRKHVVYFSEGFDGRLLFGRKPSGDDPQQREDMQALMVGQYWFVDSDDIYGHGGLQTDIGRMLEEFRRADCIIQAVDISGLTADSAAEERARDVGRDALFYIANDTGGALFEDANDFGEQLSKMLERSTVTYLLSFRPTEIELDGSYHRLRVKAEVPKGIRLSFRQGYYAPRPFEDLHPIEKSLLASDAIAAAAPRDQLPIAVLTAPFRANEATSYVPVIIEVNGRELLRDHAEDQLSAEFFAYASDANGEMKDFFTQMVTLDLQQGRKALASTGLKYYGHLELPPGEYLVRVLVRNTTTGRTGVESVPLTIRSHDEATPYLLPPFFLETNRNWLLVRESNPQQPYKRTVVYPFTVNGEPYIPAALPTLQAKQKATLCLVAYNLGEGEILLDGTIVAENGEIVDAGILSLQERTITGIEGLDKLLATFRPEGLEDGRYTLEVALRNLSSGTTETNSIPFTLGVN